MKHSLLVVELLRNNILTNNTVVSRMINYFHSVVSGKVLACAKGNFFKILIFLLTNFKKYALCSLELYIYYNFKELKNEHTICPKNKNSVAGFR